VDPLDEGHELSQPFASEDQGADAPDWLTLLQTRTGFA